MYCEENTAHQVEHFWPKSKYPERTFCWENLLLVCAECNALKGQRFKLDAQGNPLFINPTTDCPEKHLELSPKEGRWLAYDGDEKGENTAPLLNRDTLMRHRKDAWNTLQCLVTKYADFCQHGDISMSDELRRNLLSQPFPALLDCLLRFASVPTPERYVTFPGCLEAIRRHEAEFRSWLVVMVD